MTWKLTLETNTTLDKWGKEDNRGTDLRQTRSSMAFFRSVQTQIATLTNGNERASTSVAYGRPRTGTDTKTSVFVETPPDYSLGPRTRNPAISCLIRLNDAKIFCSTSIPCLEQSRQRTSLSSFASVKLFRREFPLACNVPLSR